MDQLRFTIPEILSLIGVTQCVYLVVYMGLRAGRILRAGLPLLYFLVLGLAFFLDLGQAHIGQEFQNYAVWQWFAWFFGPPLSVLLIIQIAQINRLPALRHYWVLLLPPVAFFVTKSLTSDVQELQEGLIISGLISGALSLLAIWFNRGLFDSIHSERVGKDRYWLILALVLLNISFLSTMLLGLNEQVEAQNIVIIRTVVGLGFVYLVGTSLFRIYPQSVLVERRTDERLSEPEYALARKIERLMTLEQVYQEASYSRTDLARECDTSETIISRVINAHFGKSFPQLMNEYRIEDAKRLLIETKAPVKVIASDVGFNSLASFNRVFKDMIGESPSQFRKKAA